MGIDVELRSCGIETDSYVSVVPVLTIARIMCSDME